MSEKQLFRLTGSPLAKYAAVNAVKNAPDGFVVRVEPETRRLAQSAKFHALCGDVARQAKFMNRQLTPAQWKVLFISGHAVATGQGADMVPGLEGEYVNLRESSAQMSIKRMASVIEYVLHYCADNDIKLPADKRYGDGNE
jgi:hypothetical protein